jgi:hypothetical protein
VEFLNYVLANPLYDIPRFSLWFALGMTVLSLGTLLINSGRNLRHLDKPGRKAHDVRALTGVRIIIYSIATFVYGLTAMFLYFRIGGEYAIALGIVLVAHAFFTLGDWAHSNDIPFEDAVLMFLASIILALHIWAMQTAVLAPLLDGTQSALLWCIELVLAGMVIHGFVKPIREDIPELRRIIAKALARRRER